MSKRFLTWLMLAGVAVLVIAAAANKTPILRGIMQSNLDGNGFAITNVIIDGAGITNFAGGQTNNTIVAALTNVVVVTNSGSGQTLYSVAGVTDTNVVQAIVAASATGSSNITDSGYIAVARNLTVSTNTILLGSNYFDGLTVANGTLFVNSNLWSDVNGNIRWGINAGDNLGTDKICIGFFAGQESGASAARSIFIGRHAGFHNLGNDTVNIGHAAGQYVTNGNGSVHIGYLAGRFVNLGFSSVKIGESAGENANDSFASTMIGTTAGKNAANSRGAVMIGNAAGMNAVNSYGSIYIGPSAGQDVNRHYTLIVDGNTTYSPTTNALIYGEFDNRILRLNGSLYLATNATTAAPFVSTSSSIGSPASAEFATAGWVRSLFDGFGVSYYVTTNINNTFTNSDLVTTNTAVYELNTSIPVYDRRVYTVPTNNSYIGQVTTTNRFQQLLAGAVVNSYLEAQGGTGTGGPQIKPEIYVSYDKTNWLGDWDAQPQYIPEGATNLISWVVANPTYVSTNADGFYVQRRFKMVTQTSPILSDVILHLGTNRPSHIALNGDVGTSGNAYLAANQVFTGTNTFSTWLAGNGGGLTNLPARSVGITVDGGGSAITAGTKGYISVPYSGAIVSCTLMAQPSGSIEFRIWRTNSADGSFPPTAAGAIGTNVLTSDNYNVDATLSNWTKGIDAGDVIGFNIPSAATSITNCTLQLKIQP